MLKNKIKFNSLPRDEIKYVPKIDISFDNQNVYWDLNLGIWLKNNKKCLFAPWSFMTILNWFDWIHIIWVIDWNIYVVGENNTTEKKDIYLYKIIWDTIKLVELWKYKWDWILLWKNKKYFILKDEKEWTITLLDVNWNVIRTINIMYYL